MNQSLNQLNKIISLAKNLPPYKYLKNIKTLDDFYKFPYIDPEIIRQHNKDFIINENAWRYFTTSGTTGNPKIIPLSQASITSLAKNQKVMLERSGHWPKRVAVFIPTHSLGASAPGIARALEKNKLPSIVFGIMQSPGLIISLLDKLHPDCAFVFPSMFLKITKEIKEQVGDLKKFGLKTVFCVGEPLKETVRKYIEENWGASCWQFYGANDAANFLASECSAKDGMHLLTDGTFFELPAKKGELVLTTLKNYAMPLIRYQIRDIVRVSYDRCSCGRKEPRIWLLGRSDDVVVFGGGKKIMVSEVVDELISFFPFMTNIYNFIISKAKDNKEKIVIKIECSAKNKKSLANKDIVEKLLDIAPTIVRAYIMDKIITKPEIHLVDIGTLPRENGKVKRVIDLR